MKPWRALAAVALVLLVFSQAGAEVIATNDKKVEAVADPILEAVLTGFNQGNYGLYSQDFGDTLKEAISEKKFLKVRGQILNKLGKYQSRTYLGFLTQGKTTVALWKGRFSDNDDDVLIKLVLSRRGDKVKVLGLWFQ